MRAGALLMVLVLAVLASAIGVIYAKHEGRKQFVQLQALEKLRDQMNVEWGQLQLEQGTWATHSRVERVARKRLGMKMPDAESVVILRNE
ncbi:MAG TPA: cell division protein FtsL [Gammaproteobacteria bacterium]|nr:cell division protein FtsL [Gammaproteobacteria bacterium]